MMKAVSIVSEASRNGFYPTPTNLADKMLAGIDWNLVETVLEPSAGKGDLASVVSKRMEYRSAGRYTEKCRPDIDVIEIDENLRYILKGKGFRIVFDDFMRFRTHKRYDLIVMNPPFDNGAKHLLKALELQERGGTVICLLNAETLRNPYTADRDLLLRRLQEYNASIDYIDNAFADAERKTGVEIALVKADIPPAESESILLEHLRSSQRRAEPLDANEPVSMVVGDFIQGIVDTYDFEVKAGMRLIEEWKAMVPLMPKSIVDKHKASDTILQLKMRDETIYGDYLSENAYIQAVRRKYWEALFQNPKFMEKMTSNLRQDLNARLEELVHYDFSPFNILQLHQDMNGRVLKGIEGTIMKLFDDLTHKYHWDECAGNRHYFDGWATNEAWRIGKRIVIPRMNAWEFFGFNPDSFGIHQKLSDIEKALDYLDGSLTGAIGVWETLKQAKDKMQTSGISMKYFEVTFYKKGTAHIKFTNQATLDKFNLFAARRKGWLPPAYGRKRYKDMNERERKVVDSFEGEQHYGMVMDRQDYYLSEPMPLMIGESA